MDLSKFNNDWYKPGGFLKRAIWYVCNRLFINTYIPFPYSFKRIVLRIFGAKIGKGVVIMPKVNVKYPWFLSIGDYCWIGEGVWLQTAGRITMKNNVCMSQFSSILGGYHDFKKETFDLIIKDAVLEDNVWIGAYAIVCPGVTCENGSILSVNSVAKGTMLKNCLYSGNPAKKIKDIIRDES